MADTLAVSGCWQGLVGVLSLLILMTARLWFDLTGVLIVCDDERSILRALRAAGSLLRARFGSLFPNRSAGKWKALPVFTTPAVEPSGSVFWI